jgi:hypothetical protein
MQDLVSSTFYAAKPYSNHDPSFQLARMTNSIHRTMQKPPSATASRRSTRDKSSTSSSSKEGAKSKSKDSHSKPDIKGYLRLPYPFVKAETVRLLEKLYSAGYRGKKDEAWGRIITGALCRCSLLLEARRGI